MDRAKKASSTVMGFDVPNIASYCVIELADYSPKLLKGVVGKLRDSKAVRSVYPVGYPSLSSPAYLQPPSDALFAQGSNWANNDFGTGVWWWNRHSIGNAWASSNKGNGARVAIIDNGFEVNSGNLDGVPFNLSLARGFFHDFLGHRSNFDVTWQSGVLGGEIPAHGTVDASLIGAAQNLIGSAGSSPNVDLVPIKWNGDSADLANAINYAATLSQVRVISISIANSGQTHSLEWDDTVRPALLNAYSWQHVTCVIAAGNAGVRDDYDSGKYTHSVVVGAINRNNQRMYVSSSFASNYGTRVDLAAAGQDIVCDSIDTNNGGTFKTEGWAGTSQATPIVAGAAAMLSAVIGNNPDAIRDILIGTGDIIQTDKPMSSVYCASSSDGTTVTRSLNADAAVRVAQAYNPTNHYTVYMPSADDVTAIYEDAHVFKISGYYPNNLVYGCPGGRTIIAACGNAGDMWCYAVTVFNNLRIAVLCTTGADNTLRADGTVITPTYNLYGPDPTASWANIIVREGSWWLP